MTTYKLNYFPHRVTAELTRLIFAQGGIDYEDNRVPTEEWPALKPKMPFGTMPVLEVNGEMIAESQAIAAFVAEVTGMRGDTPLERAKATMVCEGVHDILVKSYPIFEEKDEEKKKEKFTKFREDHVMQMVKNLEKLLSASSNSGEWFVGEKITYADLAVFDFFDSFTPHFKFTGSDLKDDYPKLSALFERVKQLPKIDAWLKKRPHSEY
ncbi:hematopoietic prostaglandin D synthase-like [Oscarella lobularis]|uniref:hematopoietic prostaglandin D synthase-like n=1 Tax=Oscarella lobularis TaxID=121494 RepID=UPI00331432C2